jgi:Mg2+ and Co2+ transporter CorA
MKITSYHLQLYLKVGGDVDHLQRIGTLKEKTIKNQDAVGAIQDLVSELALVKNNLASKEYAEEIELRLTKLCVDENIITKIKSLEPFS